MTLANWYWLILFLVGFLIPEAVAIFTGHYEWTLSCSLRALCARWEWFAPVFVGILAWLAYHITVQKKEEKDD